MINVFFLRNEDGAQRTLLSVPHICPTIPRILPRQRNSRESCNIVKLTTSIQFCGATAMQNIMYVAAIPVTVGGRRWWNFKILLIWRFKSGQWASYLQWRLVRSDRYYRRTLWASRKHYRLRYYIKALPIET